MTPRQEPGFDMPSDSECSQRKVLLVTMPWREPHYSCLALGALAPLLRQADIQVDTLYGELLFPFTTNEVLFLYPFPAMLFVPQLHPETDMQALWESVIRFRRKVSLDDDSLFLERRDQFERIDVDVARASTCLERCYAVAAQPQYDVVGFSLVYDSQAAASLALARRLKQHNPSVRIMFGGAACLGEQADGFVGACGDIDAVCHTEGEKVIVPLVQALRGERSLSEVEGISYRDRDGTVKHNPPPPLVFDMDSLPIPEYGDFIEQHQRSEWSAVPPEIYFETSRGCWWGQKKPCRFCGLNPYGQTFRNKSGERALRELQTLYDEYPTVRMFRAADNSLDLRYLETLFPRLAQMKQRSERPLKLFYEIRPNLRREHVALLAQGGVAELQLGIESFSDGHLKLMNKGVTALANVQVLKWAQEQRIGRIYYNLLSGIPGEQPCHYQEILDWVPALSHLRPPTGLTKILLARFSDYFNHPQSYGLSEVRPQDYYSAIFGNDPTSLMKCSYQFDYQDVNDTEEMRRLQRQLYQAVDRWSDRWRPAMAYAAEGNEEIAVVDRRGRQRQSQLILGQARILYRYLDQMRSWDAIHRRFVALDESFVAGLLEIWLHRQWALRDSRNRFLAILPVVEATGNPNQWKGAGEDC